jgi:hypothetical protein
MTCAEEKSCNNDSTYTRARTHTHTHTHTHVLTHERRVVVEQGGQAVVVRAHETLDGLVQPADVGLVEDRPVSVQAYWCV